MRTRTRRLAIGGIVSAIAVALSVPAATLSALGATPSAAFTKTVTIERDHLVNGADDVVDKRTVTVSVDETSQLRDRQEVQVSWSGAHPTGGIFGDQNAGAASQEEYPVVVMECRGTASTITPETCWTETSQERFQFSGFDFPPFRIDRYATAADRTAEAGAPNPFPAGCSSVEGITQHWVPFIAASGVVYPGGILGCAGLPPEAVNIGDSLIPSNTTYGVADTSGKGGTKFVIQTSESNASLGCSSTVACSLEVIPIMGISCDATAAGLPVADQPGALADQAFQLCSETGAYAPGQLTSGSPNAEDLAVSGALWWSASNWRNRITVPLTFAPPANVCSIYNTSAPLTVYGSEAMAQATEQWAPHFCLNSKLFNFNHVQTSEPEAKNLLASGGIDAAFVGNPPPGGFSRPIVSAPVAITGFAIVFDIDNAQGQEVTSLRLSPRLLAKLLTESYPGDIKTFDPALAKNPTTILADPEFQKLNPGLPTDTLQEDYRVGAQALLAMSSQSDVMWALTSYINSDPTARAWLNGTPDPWGMTVNPAYKGIQLPVQQWPLLDTFIPTQLFAQNSCLQTDPVPWLPLVASPTQFMSNITLDMQFSLSASQTVCVASGDGFKLTGIGEENTGQRFLIGITSLGDAERYKLDTASLQSDTSGKVFVAPTSSSLKAAVDLLKPQASIGSWPIPYDSMHTDSAGTDAYPGTMLMSLEVPTSGLAKSEAEQYATFMQFAATSGQVSGPGNGQLPAGYLPMTSANNASSLADYTLAAAKAVEAQAGAVPSVTGSSSPDSSGSNSETSSGSSPSGSSTSTSSSAHPSSSTSPSSTPSTAGNQSLPTQNVASVGRTLGVTSGFAGLLLPLVLLFALMGLVAVLVAVVLGRRQAGG